MMDSVCHACLSISICDIFKYKSTCSVVKDFCLLLLAFFCQIPLKKKMQNTENVLHINVYAHYRNGSTLIFMLIRKCINYECLEYFWSSMWWKKNLITIEINTRSYTSHTQRIFFRQTRAFRSVRLRLSLCPMCLPFHHISKCWLMRCFLCAPSHMHAQSHTTILSPNGFSLWPMKIMDIS